MPIFTHLLLDINAKMLGLHYTGATNENIVRNHLNIALLKKSFIIQTVDIGTFLSPKRFTFVRIS